MNTLQKKAQETIMLLQNQYEDIIKKRHALLAYSNEVCSDCSSHYCLHEVCQEGIAYSLKIDNLLKDVQTAIKLAEEEIEKLRPDDYSIPL